MDEANNQPTRRSALKLVLGAGLAGCSNWIPEEEHAPVRPVALVIDESLPAKLQTDQALALLDQGFSLRKWEVSQSADQAELNLVVQAIDSWFFQAHASTTLASTSILAWTKANPRLLELPLETQATNLMAHASEARFCRTLCGRGRKTTGAIDPPIESLIKRMRDDGRRFLVRLDLGPGSRIFSSEDLLL